MYFMDLKLIAPLKRLNLIVETYPVWCKIKVKSFNFKEVLTLIGDKLQEQPNCKISCNTARRTLLS